MAETAAQNERTRLLGRELRRIRKERGLTITTAAERVLRSAASLSRIENGRGRVAMRDLKFLLNEYEVTDGRERTRLFALCSEANRKGWWQRYGDVVASADLISFEAGAEKISNLETILIPGLLQTRDYLEAMLLATPFALTEHVVKRSLDARAERRRVLDRADPPSFHAVLHEAALRSVVGAPRVSREQLGHLLELSHRPHVRLQALPFGAGSHNGLSSPLTVFELPGFLGSPVVFRDDPVSGSVCVEDEEQAARYSLILNHLSAAALSEEETRSLIGSIREGLWPLQEPFMPLPVTFVSPWRRSSHSMVGDNNNCVELAATRHAVVVRDSKADGGGPILKFTRSEWADFVRRVRR